MNLKELTVKAKKLWDPNFVEDQNVAEEAKANEVMNTGATNFGKEIIPTDVMLDPMLDLVPEYSKLLPLLPGNHGNNMPISAKVPVIWEADLFYGNTEWSTWAGSFITPANHGPDTDKVVIEQGQFILTISLSKRELNYWPAQLEAYIRQKINRAAARTIDAVIINWDAETWATGNVNSDDAAPTAGLYYLQQDHGIRELAINNSKTVNAGTLDSWDFLSVIALLDPWYQSMLQDLLFIMPNTVYLKTLALAEVVTMDKFGPNATIATGILAKIWNIDIIVARDRPMAEADGKVSATASNNTKWSFGVVYKPAVQYWFGQPLEIEAYKVPWKWVDLVATFEFGFGIAFNNAGLGATVAAWINVTV